MSDTSPFVTKTDLTILENNLRAEIAEVKRHFDVVAEALKHDVLGAIRDYTSLMQDRHRDHEQRILRLERTAA